MFRSMFAVAVGMAALAWNAPSQAQTPDAALDILTHSIAFRTVEGGGQVPAYAAYLKGLLVQAGFAEMDVVIEPLGETATLTAVWQGADPALKPIILIGHMDVVAADPADWERDPFTAVVENGFVFGRGAFDNKGDISILVATLIKLKQAGWTPRRTLILALTGDEETEMATTRRLAEQLKGAEMVLNADAGGAQLNAEGVPIAYELQAAEKTYADYVLTVTDPGGHSSMPGPVNAIYRLNTALARLEAFHFPATVSPIVAAYFEASAQRAPAPLGDAMRRLVADPTDAAALAVLTASPDYVGQLRTTCVTTMISGGHAPNALPQRASATVNCRIYPGETIAETAATLTTVLADPGVTVASDGVEAAGAGASPLRADVLAAVTQAVQARAPGLAVVPIMSAYATDGARFRALGLPTYGVSSVFISPDDDFVHGLNERLPIATIAPGMAQWEALLTTLAAN